MDVLRGVSSPALVGERQFYMLARVEAAPNHQAGGGPYIQGFDEGLGCRLVEEKHYVRGCKALQYFDIQKVIIMPEKKPERVPPMRAGRFIRPALFHFQNVKPLHLL